MDGQVSTHDWLSLSEDLAARFGKILKRAFDLNDSGPVFTRVHDPAVNRGSFSIPSI
jgi:hypothetical protein